MSMTGITTGVRSAQGALTANQKVDIDSVLSLLEPYQTPLMQYLFFSGKSSKPVINGTAKFSWMEDELFPHQTTVSVAITASTTLTLTSSNIADKTIFKLQDIVYIEDTDEQAYVSSITGGGGSDVVLTHIDGSTALSTVSNTGTYLKIIGTTNVENNSTPVAMSTKEIEKYNYLTLYLEAVSNTGRNQAGQTYTDGTTHAEQVQKKMKEMKLQFERNFIFSKEKGSSGTAGSYRTYGEGMNGRFTTNVSEYTGTLDEAAWDAHLLKVSAKGTGKIQHYCGDKQFDQITQIIKAKIGSLNGAQIVTSYGARVTKYTHSRCDVSIICDPVMDGKFSYWGWSVDEGKMSARHMANDDKGSRKFRTEANVQTPGADRKETKLLADIGFQIKQEETGGVLKKV